jgi:hypothetical protein
MDYSNFPSGEALRQANHKQTAYRDKRISINRGAVLRRWHIERALVNMSESAVRWASDINERWHPGSINFPQDPMVQAQTLKALREEGVIDLIDEIQRLEGLETREQAFKFAEQRQEDKERIAELTPAPATQQQPQQRPGLAARFGGLPGAQG